MPAREIDQTSIARPVKLAHLVLRSGRFDKSLAFYKDLLGVWAIEEAPFGAFLTFDDEHHRLAIINTPDAPKAADGAVGVDHFAFTMADLGALLGTWERMKATGVEPYWCVNHGMTTSMYFRDPDGNRVELQVDNFESLEDQDNWFKTGAFSKNPIGIEFDPEELASAYRAGEPLEELLKPHRGG